MTDVFSIVRPLLITPLLVFAIIPLGRSQDQAVVARRLSGDHSLVESEARL
jgi:hypothetical protein